MGLLAPAFVRVHPSYVVPEMLTMYVQASSAFDILPNGQPEIRLSDIDLAVYIKRVEVRTKIAANQSSINQLPGVSIDLSYISAPTYLFQVRAEYNHHEIAMGSAWGISTPEAYRLGMRQATFQLLRSALLYGINPANGEGIANTANATSVSLPPDSQGNTTIATYDNGQLAFFFLAQVSAMKSRTMQLGQPRKIVIIGPQRDLGPMEYQNIVQLVQYQRTGAGTASTADLIREVLSSKNDELLWGYDDTLIGKGAGGTDLILIVMPEVKQQRRNKINTNEISKISPGLDANLLMFCNMAAPMEIPVPLAGGAIDVTAELRSTSGMGIRPEAVTLLSVQNS